MMTHQNRLLQKKFDAKQLIYDKKYSKQWESLLQFKGLWVYILSNQKKSFGKSLSDIKLEGDATISRLHAVVSVEPTEESETEYKCVINDVSKYGTFVIRNRKKKKLPADNKFALKAGDIVQFGLKESIFVVLCHSFIIARSSLDEEDMKKLKDIVDHLKAKLSETWENFCTHLTVAKSTLFTTKLACALASARPIVTIAYWEAVNIAVKESKKLPEIENFLPKVKEEWLKVCPRLFLPNEKRRTLFKGLSFVHFCKKQYFAYMPLITAAGGKSCVYPTKRPLTPGDLIAKNAIVIQQPTSDSSQLTQAITADYPIIYHKLQAVKHRMVSDTEIPLAILYCTTKMYCNPKFDFATFLKSKTQIFSSSDIMVIENTQDIIDKRQIKRKVIPETCESQNNENIPKKIRCFDENKRRHISDVNKSNIAIMQDVDNRDFNKREIISETCNSQTTKNISKNTYFFSENVQKHIYDVSKNNIAMKNTQNADNEEIKCKITTETCNFQNNENISKKTRFLNENEYRYVFDINKSNFAAKTQNNRNILKNIYFSEEGKQKNISDSSESNIMSNILSNNINEQFQIIPDSCNSLEKNISNIFSDKRNNEQVQIILKTCEFNEEYVVNNFAIEKMQQNIELQKKEIFEENMIFAKNSQRKNMFISEENNSIFEKNNSSREENLIVEKDNLNNNNSKSANIRCENSKNAKIPQIGSIKKNNDSEIYIKQGKENTISGKDRSKIEMQNSLKKQTLRPVCVSGRNCEDKKVNENKIQIKHNGKKEIQKTVSNWYERYLNREFMDEILRKDIPCGKKFMKMPVMKPERILGADDFAL